MADVFHQLYIQVVFAVKNRQSLIDSTWEESLYKYATGVVQQRGHKLLAIGGMPDHIHVFIGLKPSESLSDLVRELKKSTQAYVSERGFTPYQFRWQSGYGAFSYSRSQIDTVCKYVLNQKAHHRKTTFQDEFIAMIKEFEIDTGKKISFDYFS